MRKRLSVLLLILILGLQFLTTISFAEETEEMPEEETAFISHMQDGDFLYFGEIGRAHV